MRNVSKILIGSAGLAAMAIGAAPAAAQTSPYGYNQGGIAGVINSVLGGGRYGAYGQGQDRVGVDQCARAAEARLSSRYNGGYNQGYGYQGYGNQGYGNRAMANARVIGITRVERKSSGLRVSGVIDSGMGYGNPGYGYGNQGYDPRYSDPRYNQGYGNPQGYDPRYADPRYNQGYGNQAYGYDGQQADLRFDCRVDYRGRVTSLDIKRNIHRGG